MKTANQLYREYKEQGGDLNFKQWIDSTKQSNVFIRNDKLEKRMADFVGADGTTTQTGKQSFLTQSVMGIPVWVLSLSVIVITGAIIYHRYES